MPALISFEDAVTGANLDPNQTHAVFYADGTYANRTAVAARCPHAKLYGITVRGQTGKGIFACDSETGDMGVDSTVAWVDTQVRLGVELICVYANLNRWLNEGLKARLDHYGPRIKRWVALYNGVPRIQPWADAEQYADPGPIDRNVALANFFGDATPPPPPPPPPRPYCDYAILTRGERKVVLRYDGARQQPAKYRTYLLLLRAQLTALAAVVYVAAHKNRPPSWGVRHRGVRYQMLARRAAGTQLTLPERKP